jgi:hypothetical protein
MRAWPTPPLPRSFLEHSVQGSRREFLALRSGNGDDVGLIRVLEVKAHVPHRHGKTYRWNPILGGKEISRQESDF